MLKPSKIEISNVVTNPVSQGNILTAAKGSGIVFIGGLFQQAVRFVIGVLLARFLGADQLGLYNLALTVATVAGTLALLGLPTAMVRFISLARSQHDQAGLKGTLQVGLGVTTVASLFVCLMLFVGADTVAVDMFHEPRLVPLLRLTILIVPFLTLSNIIAAATRGFKRMEYTVIASKIIPPIFRFVLILGLIVSVGLNTVNALVAFAIVSVVSVGFLFYYLNKLFSLRHFFEAGRRAFRELFSFSLPIYLTTLIQTFQYTIQTALLGVTSTVATVGVYTVAGQINIIGAAFYGGVSMASSPIVADLYGRGEREQLGHFYQVVTKWLFTVNFPLFIVVILFPVSILSIFGESFTGGYIALIILAWANLVYTCTGIGSVIIDMSGYTHLKLVNSITATAVTLVVSATLIPLWGLVGAAVATLISISITNLLPLLEAFFLFYFFPYDLSFLKPLLAGLIMLGVGWGMHFILGDELNIIYLTGCVVVLLLVYASIIALLRISQEDRIVLSHMRQRLQGRFSG